MERVWMSAALGDALVRNEELISLVPDVVNDLKLGVIDIAGLIEHMATVLTHKETHCRERGVRFMSTVLIQLPVDILTSLQLKFISIFYVDRLRDHHSIIPAVLEGYLALTRMPSLMGECVVQFLSVLFQEVSCQALVKTERANAFHIMLRFLRSYPENAISMGDNLICGVINAIEGERDPNNLLLSLELAAELSRVVPPSPSSQLSEELFDVLSCYFPVDYTPPPTDALPVTREQIATALATALTALPQFSQPCLLLTVEKLDSSLRLAKIDSLKLLEKGLRKFEVSDYLPFLKSLWASIHREICQKSDNELKMAAHSALHSLLYKLSENEEILESFLKPVLSGLQSALANSHTSISFGEVCEVLKTCAGASPASCKLTADFIIPPVAALHSLRQEGSKLKMAALTLLKDLYMAAKRLNVKLEQSSLIPQICVDSQYSDSQHQIVALQTLAVTADALARDRVPALADRLLIDAIHENDDQTRQASVFCLRVLASFHPDIISEDVVTEKLKLDTGEKGELLERSLSVWSNLSCVDSLTQIAMKRLLQLARGTNLGAVAGALVACVSDEVVCSDSKVAELDRQHGLVDTTLTWLCDEVAHDESPELLVKAYSLIAVTVRRLSSDDQLRLVNKHTDALLKLCEKTYTYLLILEALYNSLQPDVVTPVFPQVAAVATRGAILSPHELVRHRACVLLAHLLNKPDPTNINEIYSAYTKTLASMIFSDEIRPQEMLLYVWVTKSLMLRSDERFKEWFFKIIKSLSEESVCDLTANYFEILVSDKPECLTVECHCRVSPLFLQRVLQTMLELAPRPHGKLLHLKLHRACLHAWTHVLCRVPERALKMHFEQLTPILLDSLTLQDGVLLERALLAMKTPIKARFLTLQTLLPRLIALTKFEGNMMVRIGSLECLYQVASAYSTPQLLPHRDHTLAEVGLRLDDSKRLVRAAAVRACSRWTLIGAPGEPDRS